MGARPARRRRPRGDDPRPAAAAHAGRRAGARDPVRAHDAARPARDADPPASAATRDARRSGARGPRAERHRATSSSRPSASIPSSGTGTRRSSPSVSRASIPERARTEVRSLLRGQWADGMVPHMVFHPQPVDYPPGPELWGSSGCEGRPRRRDERADRAARARDRRPGPARGGSGRRRFSRRWCRSSRTGTAGSIASGRDDGLGAHGHLPRLGVGRQRAALRSRARADRRRGCGADPADRQAARSTPTSGRPTSTTGATSRSSHWLRERGVPARTAVVGAVRLPRSPAQLDPRGRRGRSRVPPGATRAPTAAGARRGRDAARRARDDVGRGGGRLSRARPARRGGRHRTPSPTCSRSTRASPTSARRAAWSTSTCSRPSASAPRRARRGR